MFLVANRNPAHAACRANLSRFNRATSINCCSVVSRSVRAKAHFLFLNTVLYVALVIFALVVYSFRWCFSNSFAFAYFMLPRFSQSYCLRTAFAPSGFMKVGTLIVKCIFLPKIVFVTTLSQSKISMQ